ncbi:MAG: matrixin family metalloprotease [Planctomycetota bacterium]
MMHWVRIGGLCFILAGQLLEPTEVLGQDNAVEYSDVPKLLPVPAICFAPGTPPEVVEAAYGALEDAQGGLPGVDRFEFQDGNRWSETAVSGGGLAQGDPTVLTWSYLPDGTFIDGLIGEPPGNSNLRSWLNGIYGDFGTWHALFVQVFDRWAELTGVTYIYEPNDDGASFPGPRGVLGVRGDVRIGGHFIDDDLGILAYNFFPEGGDMVLDSADSFYNNTGNNSHRLRNVLAHEHGHGLGISHVCPVDFTKLMEPFVSTLFDGPQHDDTLAANRGYGDRFEHNDTSSTATDLGAVNVGSTITVQDVSVDDDSDVNWYGVTLPAGAQITLTVTPVGSTYPSGPQHPIFGVCSADTPFNSLAQSDLGVQVLAPDAATIRASVDLNPAGFAETITNLDLVDGAGTYFLRVFGGTANAAQLYYLELNVVRASFSGCGTLVQRVECLLFEADSGGLYVLKNYGSFGIGDRVDVTGVRDPFCITLCSEDDGCIGSNTIELCPDVCDPPATITASAPEDRHSLWRSKRNIMRVTFDADVPDPNPGDIQIVECLPGCEEGANQSGFFDISVENPGSGPRVLRLQDTDLTPTMGHLKHEAWYKVRNKAWACVEPFEFQFVVLYGNADDTLFVDNTDLSVINGNFGFYPGVDDLRFDINGDGFVDNEDMSIANAHMSGFVANLCCP